MWEAIKDIEAIRQQNAAALERAIAQLRHDHDGRIKHLENQLQNLPSQIKDHAAQFMLLQSLLLKLPIDVTQIDIGQQLFRYEDNRILSAIGQTDKSVDLSELLETLQASALKFPQPHYRAESDMPSQLLNSEYEAVPFYGRDEELNNILEWCIDSKRFGLRLYAGAGGMGKTRLMREVIRHLTASDDGHRWQAGFIDRETIQQYPNSLDILFKSGRPLLIIVDYAETQREIIEQLLKIDRATIEEVTKPKTVRIILLTRNAGWWQQFEPKTQRADLPNDAIELAPINEIPSESYRRAIEAFSNTDSTALSTTPDLNAAYYDRVLFIHMRALLTINHLGGTFSEEELLNSILELEKRYWHKNPVRNTGFDNDAIDNAIAQAMTVITLGYVVNNKSDMRALLKEIPYT